MKINKGDIIVARCPATRYDHPPYNIIQMEQKEFQATVTKVFKHGVKTREIGYVHRINILKHIDNTNNHE